MLKSLPTLFLDAITIVRRLGFRYVWIDSLCIIQDSTEDWQRECAKMAMTYEFSALTVAGPDAADSSESFLTAWRSSTTQPCTIDYGLTDNDTFTKVVLQYWECQNYRHWPIGMSDIEPLEPRLSTKMAERAWILQERLLSRRVLYFGAQGMFWECNTHQCYEYIQFSLRQDRKRAWFINADKVSCTSLHSPREWYNWWYRIVTAYSRCTLTMPADKFPALSGMAAKLYEHVNDAYTAGLWKRDLFRGLLWQVHMPAMEKPGCGAQTWTIYKGRAPSWSWASLDAVIEWTPHSMDPGLYAAADFEVLEAFVQPVGPNPFGQLQAGILRLRGRLTTAHVAGRLYPYTYRLWDSNQNVNWFRMQGEEGGGKGESPRPLDLGKLYVDDPGFGERCQLDQSFRSIPVVCLSVGEAFWDDGVWWHMGLAIEKTSGFTNRYRRIGVVYESEDSGENHGRLFDDNYKIAEIELV